jgi:hypothetical protein
MSFAPALGDQLGIELELPLHVGASQQEDGRSGRSEACVQRLAAARRRKETERSENERDYGREDRWSVTHGPIISARTRPCDPAGFLVLEGQEVLNIGPLAVRP